MHILGTILIWPRECAILAFVTLRSVKINKAKVLLRVRSPLPIPSFLHTLRSLTSLVSLPSSWQETVQAKLRLQNWVFLTLALLRQTDRDIHIANPQICMESNLTTHISLRTSAGRPPASLQSVSGRQPEVPRLKILRTQCLQAGPQTTEGYRPYLDA